MKTTCIGEVGIHIGFDKYLQIYVAIQDVQTQEFVWVNEGIYMVNSPTITYDATSNQLSFQAVDLMSKMTGLRDGYLEGMTYSVPAGSISNSIKSILFEQGLVIILYIPHHMIMFQRILILRLVVQLMSCYATQRY